MNNEVFELFFSLLSLGTLGFGLLTLGARMAGADGLVYEIKKIALPLAALITTTAMFGSLYFSEIVNYKPCRLCWYQRAAMYPLAIILIVMNFKRFKYSKLVVVLLAVVGGSISTYHWFLERFPDLDAGVCDAKLPCEFIWFENFGFVTLSFMAFTAFFTTIVLATIGNTEDK
ncbi:MAG: disulfide bond formation protein B [Actinobacteria bacterium]|jgi:disulfide bond formation protein DsbB|nr:disulfide bond formation protein B [Actinomycetota bacterium]